jgi:SAM-dependent methyltransferase
MDTREYTRLAEHEEWYWWHRAREMIVRRVLQRHAPANARILDVGCGTGATTASLRPFGSVLGLDIGSEALGHAHERNLPVARSSAAQLPVPPGAFDVVVALDLLEHLDDDVAAAGEIRAALAPGGFLLATVPAYPFLWSSHDIALEHRRRYTRRQLRDVLERAGFEVELCSYMMSAILPAAMAVRLAERLRPRAQPPAESGYLPLPSFLNSLLTHLVGLDGYLVRWLNLPFGLSVLALARRRSQDHTCGAADSSPDYS